MLEMSPRTLQRLLAEEDTSFSEVTEKLQYQKALQLLLNPRQSIQVISQILGYAYRPNFERAYQRWTKTSPQKFRNN